MVLNVAENGLQESEERLTSSNAENRRRPYTIEAESKAVVWCTDACAKYKLLQGQTMIDNQTSRRLQYVSRAWEDALYKRYPYP